MINSIDDKIPKSGKVLIRDNSAYFEESSFIENILINRDLPFLRHFRFFANPNDLPTVYYRIRDVSYNSKNLTYLWITHILPFKPKKLKQQLYGLKKINDKIDEVTKNNGLDLILTTGTNFFKKSLAEKFSFKIAFATKNRAFYIKDLKDQIQSDNYFNIYQKAFPYNRTIRKYAKSK